MLSEIAKLAFLDIRRAFNPDGSLKHISELDGETAAAVAGIEHEKLFDHFGRGQAKHVGTTTKSSFPTSSEPLKCSAGGTSFAYSRITCMERASRDWPSG